MVFSNPSLIVGLILWFVGFIFILNGINMTGRISPKECGVWNLAVSGLMFFCIMMSMIFQLFGDATWVTVGGITMFAFTYFMLGMNNVLGMDGRGLGYYCLLVALMTPFISESSFSAGDWRFGVIWLVWGAIWFLFFLIMGLGKTKLATPMLGNFLVLIGALTGTVPGYMMLRGWW